MNINKFGPKQRKIVPSELRVYNSKNRKNPTLADRVEVGNWRLHDGEL
jgi:hypothetical protein